MPRFTSLALTALLALAAGCATLSKGDIKRQTESQNTTLDAVRAGSDTADRAARTQSESTAAIIEATGRARAEETRAAAELAREQQKLEEIRARNAEREQRAQQLRAQIEQAEREDSEADRELARLERKARAMQKLKARAEARWVNCFTDVILTLPKGDKGIREKDIPWGFDIREGEAYVTEGESIRLSEIGAIYIVKRSEKYPGFVAFRGQEVTICPKKNMLSLYSLSDIQEIELREDASRYFHRFTRLDR